MSYNYQHRHAVKQFAICQNTPSITITFIHSANTISGKQCMLDCNEPDPMYKDMC